MTSDLIVCVCVSSHHCTIEGTVVLNGVPPILYRFCKDCGGRREAQCNICRWNDNPVVNVRVVAEKPVQEPTPGWAISPCKCEMDPVSPLSSLVRMDEEHVLDVEADVVNDHLVIRSWYQCDKCKGWTLDGNLIMFNLSKLDEVVQAAKRSAEACRRAHGGKP